MKFFYTTIICVLAIIQVNAQRNSVYSAESKWVRINTKSVVSPTPIPKPVKRVSIIQDDFINPTNPYKWVVGNFGGNTFLRDNGSYKITTSTGAADITSVIDSKFNLDSVNFSLEAIIVSKDQLIPRAGIVWGYKDKDNYMAFKINSQGSFAFIFMNSGENISNDGYKSYPEINERLKNKLTIKKIGVEMSFFINDKLVYNEQYGSMNSTQIGLVTSDLEAKFESFKFQQISN